MSNYPNQISCKFYVYCAKNTINNKVYIGKTNDVDKRLQHHKLAGGDCPAFHGAIKKYGFENFIITICGEYDDEKNAFDAEIKFIEQYKSNITKYGKNYGYNLTAGGDGISGHKHSNESRMKISKKLKGRISGNKGKKASPELLKKLSENHLGNPGYWTGKTLSQNHIDNLSESHKNLLGNFKGKHHTKESKEKISKGQKGMTEELSNASKLTIIIAKQIRELYKLGIYTQKQLAEKFSLGKTTIFRVLSNLTYFAGEENNE